MSILSRFKRAKVPPRDYLYVDSQRLNSYLEQISSTKTHDKSPSLQVELSVTSISVRAEQISRHRDKTDHEKICELIKYLDRHGHLGHRRLSLNHEGYDDTRVPDFVLEECDAVRVLIPAVDRGKEWKEGVVIWLSEWPLNHEKNALRPPGLLCIIQDSTSDDKRYRAGFSHSGYTWVAALLHQLNQQPRKTQLSAHYPSSPMGDYLYDLMQAQQYLQNEMKLFRPHPLEWLRAKGCEVLSSAQRITALYRIRNVGVDEMGTQNRDEDFMVSTFAYGIAIWGEPIKTMYPAAGVHIY